MRVHLFAKEQSIEAKTDRIDSGVLALFAVVMAAPARDKGQMGMDELKELVAERERVRRGDLAREPARCGRGQVLNRQLTRRIARIDEDNEALESEIQ